MTGKGQVRLTSMSLAHDMTGLCSTRSVRFVQYLQRGGGADETDDDAARSSTDEVRECASDRAAVGGWPDQPFRDKIVATTSKKLGQDMGMQERGS